MARKEGVLSYAANALSTIVFVIVSSGLYVVGLCTVV